MEEETEWVYEPEMAVEYKGALFSKHTGKAAHTLTAAVTRLETHDPFFPVLGAGAMSFHPNQGHCWTPQIRWQ